ncbi:FAD-dependent urate hydroxylase HpxO [Oscillatoria sp. CS-180]|uniref:FAD-dependent urate hydroxylase HpxO n=1 Tax=Oscillatoria sp. CS-180 TaxID=3021720 RepID=UPI00232AEF28|nr:FAD-dependent urate hydroxylase HpxO [Oscillatoria sp. CS-180]MDB9526913.1 FAD-dependent urate hydroxylase HpxO [Oscillatoria sp. CS-180]
MYGLKAVVIGAGMAGLATAIALRQAGYEVDVYEKTSKIRPAGAGISLWSNGIKVLNRLGLGEAVAAIGGQMNRMEYRTHKDDLLNDIDLIPLMEKVGQRPYPVSRTDLQDIMVNAFGENNIHMGMRCVGVKQDEQSATAIFEDGSTATGDIVIGADGIHSEVRSYIAGPTGTRYADYVNWNGLVDIDEDLPAHDSWVIYVGEGKRASMMPVGGDRFYFFFGCPKPQGTSTEPEEIPAELAGIFAGWAKPVQHLIQKLDPQQVNRLEISDLDPLPQLVKGRVALVGDSAHASTPTLGQGGCQAMEDAEVLCRYLVTTNISVEDALKRYEAERKERVADLVLKARKRTDKIYNKVPKETQEWYEQLKYESPQDVTDAIAKVILGGPFR